MVIRLKLNRKNAQPRARLRWFNCGLAAALGIAAIFFGSLVTPAAPAIAQDLEQAWLDGAQAWRGGGCGNCHGKWADGAGDPNFPLGPNLRETDLTRDEILETVRCGRPGTAMPFHDAGAYTVNSCFEIPVGEVLAAPGQELDPEQIENLATYIAEAVKGAGKVSLKDCIIYYNGRIDSPSCTRYR